MYVYMYVYMYICIRYKYICTGTSLLFPQKKNVITFFFIITPDFSVGKKKKECEQIARTDF